MTLDSKKYDELLKELFCKHPSVQKQGFNSGAYKKGLGGILGLDRALHHPWKHFRSIHVAGTNGKGSVSSMLAAALGGSGLRVGLYTSPHMSDFRERIKLIDGSKLKSETELAKMELIPKEEVYHFLTENTLDGLSFFEITTGMAFWWFAKQKVDWAVIEVGLGGRLDSTNIIHPELSIICSIGLDHCAILGDNRETIAKEKAGIFKPNVPAIVWGEDPETNPIFESVAAEKLCPLIYANKAALSINEKCFNEILLNLDLQGPYQKENLRTALAALGHLYPNTSELSLANLKHCGHVTGLRGRWERLQNSPEVICDIGHNPAALEINFSKLQQSKRPLFIVFGIMADKDLDSISALLPIEAEYILTAPHNDRALDIDVLKARLDTLRPELNTCTASSVDKAIRLAITRASQIDNSLVYIGGSNFVVSEAVDLFPHKGLQTF